jgi:hypothetical protein
LSKKEYCFGNLRLSGNIEQGQLLGIADSDSGLCFDFSATRNLFQLELELDTCPLTCGLNEFKIVLVDGAEWLKHATKAIYVKLDWEKFDNDCAVCKFSFRSDDAAIVLRSIHYSLPEKVAFSNFIRSDFLMLPRATGMKIPQPATEFFKVQNRQMATWKDRVLSVWHDGFQDSDKELNSFEYRIDAAMGWVDYYCDQGGIYLGAHDVSFDQTEVTVSVDRGKAGIGMELVKTINRHLNEYETDFAIALHKGDWHRGADLYRQFYDQTSRHVRLLPSFMRKSPGIICHYDFKWQDGSINHRFKDIEALYDAAVELGYNQMLIAGWNRGGFDNCYPDFSPAPELGSEQELIDAVQVVNAKGGQVFFYINAYSYDFAEPGFDEYGSCWAAKKKDGTYYEQQYSSSTLIGMCNSAKGWRNQVKENIKYLIEKIGAAGVYIDQLNVTPIVCYDRSHKHEYSWKLNNASMLNEVRKELGQVYEDKIFLFSEWANDGVITEIDSLLIQACWFFSLKYSTPEMFRYTFPEMAALDMIMQKPWPADPAALEQQFVKQQFCKMFINGILFWTYDHVAETPGFSDFFRQAIKFRNRVADYFADGRFVDDINIECCSDGIVAKMFELQDGGCFICVWNQHLSNGFVRLNEMPDVESIRIISLDEDDVWIDCNKNRNIECPKAELSIIIMENRK